MTEEVTATEEAAVEVAAAEVAQVAALRAKLVQAELRTAAARAGMIDLDGVKLVDAVELERERGGRFGRGAGDHGAAEGGEAVAVWAGQQQQRGGGAAGDAAKAEDGDGDVGG